MAVECGLRISPDQWSALLYGDQAHRSHMQSIIDRLQTPHSYMQGIDELAAVASGSDSSSTACDLAQMAQLLRVFDTLPGHHERVGWTRFADYIDALYKLVKSTCRIYIKTMNSVLEMRSVPLLLVGPTTQALSTKLTRTRRRCT
ncbi:hypothetical protein OESDEN_16948, partial [Oesophagostomum dentatum]